MKKTVAFNSGRINSNVGGDILTVTAGVGQHLKLTHLTTSSISSEGRITLTVDGADIFTDKPLTDGVSPTATTAVQTSFGVAQTYGGADVTTGARMLEDIKAAQEAEDAAADYQRRTQSGFRSHRTQRRFGHYQH